MSAKEQYGNSNGAREAGCRLSGCETPPQAWNPDEQHGGYGASESFTPSSYGNGSRGFGDDEAFAPAEEKQESFL